MAARAEQLGDRGPSAPEHWEAGLGTGDAHVLVTVYAVDVDHLRAALAEILGADSEHAVELVHLQRAESLAGGRDHFGFFDGIAQPALIGSGVTPRPGDGQPDGKGGWRGLATGEVLLGYRDEDGTLPVAPVAPFERNGTFVVYRKLAMHVGAFRSYIAAEGERYPGGPRELAAKIVGPLAGRHAAGPLPRRPRRVDLLRHRADQRLRLRRRPRGPALPARRRTSAAPTRATRRASSTAGSPTATASSAAAAPTACRCPAGALEDDGADRGLVFICFQANIWRQFETIQSLWIDDGDPFGLGRDKDFLVGEPHGTNGKMTIQGHPPYFLKPQPRFVTTRGGEYLFQPSMSALRRLAGVE